MSKNKNTGKFFLDEEYRNYSRYILGSSRVLNIHLSDKPSLADMYNFGISGAVTQQEYFILTELCKVQKPELILLQVRFDNFFEAPWVDTAELEKTFVENDTVNWDFYLSSELVHLSYKTLNNAIRGRSVIYLNKDGSLTYAKKERDIRAGKHPMSKRDFIAHAIGWNPEGMRYSVESFWRIKQVADRCGVELIPFIVPEHEALFSYLLKERKEEYLQARRDLIDIFGSYYDFCGLNEVNMDLNNFHDSTHYREHVGDMILGRILDIERLQKDGFGTFVNRDTIEKHLTRLQADAKESSYNGDIKKALEKRVANKLKREGMPE